jgi:transposase
MKAIPDSVKLGALQLLKSGLSTRAVAKHFGVSQSTIARLRASNKDNIPTLPSGCKRKLNHRDDRHIAKLATTGKTPTATAIQQELKRFMGCHVHRTTVARSLKHSGLGAFKKVKKPLLTTKHQKARLSFARQYQKWSVEDWKKVFFSDETKINRYGSDGNAYCWRKHGAPLQDQHITPTIKHGGGSIMVWGCFCADGPGYLCMIEGRMNAEDYQGILASDFLDSIEYYGREIGDVIFQHDNDPKHTAVSTKKWLQDHGISTLQWPSQSPDMNPIEHIWWEVKNRLKHHETTPQNNDELWAQVQAVWNTIDKETCMKLVESMPHRIQAVIKAKGRHTKY